MTAAPFPPALAPAARRTALLSRRYGRRCRTQETLPERGGVGNGPPGLLRNVPGLGGGGSPVLREPGEGTGDGQDLFLLAGCQLVPPRLRGPAGVLPDAEIGVLGLQPVQQPRRRGGGALPQELLGLRPRPPAEEAEQLP